MRERQHACVLRTATLSRLAETRDRRLAADDLREHRRLLGVRRAHAQLPQALESVQQLTELVGAGVEKLVRDRVLGREHRAEAKRQDDAVRVRLLEDLRVAQQVAALRRQARLCDPARERREGS
jgi:hypothetical protein